MPSAGAVEYAFSRQYKFIKPGGNEPGAYRLATPPVYLQGGSGSGGGGGGTGGTIYDFDGVEPVVVTTLPPAVSGPTIVQTSLDFQRLNDRAK